MNETIKYPAEYYLARINQNKPFSLARFGDGEIIAMQLAPHKLVQNCDGSRFIPDLVAPMRQIFKNNYDYFHCLLDCSFNENGEQFKQFVEETCPNMQFYDGEIWQHLSFGGRIREFVDAINTYYPCFVGGRHIAKVQHMRGLDKIRYINAPDKDSFYKFNELFDGIMDKHAEGCRMFLFSCGYTTKLLIDTLFPYIGHDTFLIDVGSLFDPFVGRLSRDGMKFKGKQFFQPYTKMML